MVGSDVCHCYLSMVCLSVSALATQINTKQALRVNMQANSQYHGLKTSGSLLYNYTLCTHSSGWGHGCPPSPLFINLSIVVADLLLDHNLVVFSMTNGFLMAHRARPCRCWWRTSYRIPCCCCCWWRWRCWIGCRRFLRTSTTA